jgi:uncharacterized protein involved in type VI secretion and phage assembly
MGADADDRLHGVWRAVVVEEADPEKAGRVRIDVPAVPAAAESWARLALWFHPRAGDEVLVAFEAGDLRRPVVVGGLWSSSDSPPGEATDGASDDRDRG